MRSEAVLTEVQGGWYTRLCILASLKKEFVVKTITCKKLGRASEREILAEVYEELG